jgi:3-(3-hydroxy-phenyl)propionate hydroxylase
MKQDSDEDRVLIAGGGPSGMAAALFLSSQGVPVTLLERSRTPHDDPRAATYHPPSLEMLEASGVTDELHRRGIVARKWQYRDRREGLVAEFDLQVLEHDTRYPYRLQCEQHKLVAMMERRVAGSPLATIRHDAEVVEVRQHESGVEVVTRDAAGAHATLRGRWLVGADGGRSVVRKSQDIGFEGFTWPERFLVVTTTFDFETLGFAYSNYTMDPVEWTASFKVPGEDGRGIWRCVFPTKPEENEAELLDFARAAERLAGFVQQSRAAKVIHTNLYAVHQRVASTYRRGRVLLAGDAAHVNNPLGGMGLNFGLHDAHSLAQRLAKVWRGEAPDDLMDQYDRQRRAVAEQYLQGQTIANKQTLEERDPAKRAARQAEMRAQAADPQRARQFLLRTSMIEGLAAAAAIA